MTATPGIVARIHAPGGSTVIQPLRERGGKYEAEKPRNGPQNGIDFLLIVPRVTRKNGYVTVFCNEDGSELASQAVAVEEGRYVVKGPVVGTTATKGIDKVVTHRHDHRRSGRRAWLRTGEIGRGIAGSLPRHIKRFEPYAQEAKQLLG